MSAKRIQKRDRKTADPLRQETKAIAQQGIDEVYDLETELHARLRQQAAISDLGQLALTEAPLGDIMSRAVQSLAELLDLEYIKVLELLPDGEGFLLKYGVGWNDGLIGHAVIPVGKDSQAGYTLASNQPVIVTDLREETRFSGPALLVDHGIVSGMSVIIKGAKGPYGVLGAHSARRREFSENDINFLQSMANILAEAIGRERLLTALRNQATIIEQIHDSVVTTDLDGIVTSWNHGAEVIFGYTKEEAIGRHISFVYEDDQYDFLQHKIIEPLLKSGEHKVEVRMHRKSGRPFYAHLSLSLQRDVDDQIVGLIGYSMDITERKIFATQVHELGRSLGSITAAIQALKRGAWENQDLREDLLAGIDQETRRFTQLLEDMKTIDERASGTLQINRQPIDLMTWLPSILASWKEMALSKKQSWDCRIPDGLPQLQADPGRLDQVIGNLLSNAIKYTDPGGKVAVECGTVDRELWIQVIDSGKGIEDGDRLHIFMPFYRSSNTKYNSRGMGLGLTIVRDLVKAHGGRIEVESKPAEGSKFTIFLPLDEPPDETGQRQGSS
ncbi:MAG: ATP-binding protein [Anaerolineales bacterium]